MVDSTGLSPACSMSRAINESVDCAARSTDSADQHITRDICTSSLRKIAPPCQSARMCTCKKLKQIAHLKIPQNMIKLKSRLWFKMLCVIPFPSFYMINLAFATKFWNLYKSYKVFWEVFQQIAPLMTHLRSLGPPCLFINMWCQEKKWSITDHSILAVTGCSSF